MPTCVIACGSCARIYKQGHIPAICNIFLLKNFKIHFFLPTHEAEIKPLIP